MVGCGVHRGVVLVALVACEAPPAPTSPPVPRTLYPASSSGWPLGALRGRIGRSQAPQPVVTEPIAGEPAAPLRLPTPWTVPGDGPARAIVYGLDGERPAIELVDIDRGRVAWRDTTACAAPVVGVTAEAVVCADTRGIRAVGLDGTPRWHVEATFIAINDDHVIAAGAGESVIYDAGNGDELARVKLPAGVTSDAIVASCGDAGRELFAVGQDGRLSRIAEAKGGPKLAWSVPIGSVAGIDACAGATVLVTTSTAAGTALVAIARDTGKVSGRIDGVHGYWPARDGLGGLEVSTGAGVGRVPRDLAVAVEPIALPVLGELLAKRGDRRLVRATPLSCVVLDRDGVRAYLPLAELGAVLGDDAILAASWLGSAGETVHRIAIPPPWRRALRIPGRAPPVGVPAELRDLPGVEPLASTEVYARPDAGKHAVAAVALDPIDPDVLYAIAIEADTAPAGLARFDLARFAWAWVRGDGCGAGTPIALAIARGVVVCGARSAGHGASVRATGHDGKPRWEWTGDNVDTVTAAADLVLVHDADRLVVLDANDGHVLATLASDDGAAVRAVGVDVGATPLLVAYERGRVVARLPRAQMLPAWSVAIGGVVRALSASNDGVLIELEDGDAFRVDARTAAVTAIAGLDLVWRASGDVILGQAPGGPVPPDTMPERPRVPLVRRPIMPSEVDLPPIAKPWQVPSSLAPSWQLSVYQLDGSVRTRNDYALVAPIAPAAARGPGTSPVVVESGPGLREAMVIDVRSGDPLRRMRLPDDAAPGLAFSTIVDGKPYTGTILAAPLRVVLF
jgi:hypothetical protein